MTVFMRQTIIAHLDLDEFYVAVERIKDPSLKNKPVVVGGSPTGRGVVSSASYEARKYGIHSAMPMYQAMKLCPHLIRVGGKFREYSKYSSSVFGIVGEYSEFVERTGIDEGYIELTDSVVKLNKTALQLAEEIKQRIDKDVGLSVSFGIGSNKMMAKIASKHAKPNGILEILPNKEESFLKPMNVSIIPGVGPKTKEKLNNLGITSIEDLRGLSEKELRSRFGIHGEGLYKRARGIASSNLNSKRERKSISNERTFSLNIRTPEGLIPTINRISMRICEQMKEKEILAKSVSLKLRFENFETITRAKTLSKASRNVGVIKSLIEQMIHSNFIPGRSVRLVGVKVSNFELENVQTELIFM